MTHKVFFITGVSSGLGRALAETALSEGHTVVGTVRRPESVVTFEGLEPGRSHALTLDVTDDQAVFSAVEGIERNIGPIDVAVANAGYGLEGLFEETTLSQMREQFATNVFGAAATLQAVLPHMRERRRGHLMGVTSMGGLMTVPGLSAYCASKYALEGLLETIGKEVAAFGIHVTAIAPGSFRTDWAGRSMVRAANTIGDYDELFEPIRRARLEASGKQLGNPDKAAQAILQILDVAEPPKHLVLGSDALRLVATGRRAVDYDISNWEELSRSTDFPDGHQIASN